MQRRLLFIIGLLLLVAGRVTAQADLTQVLRLEGPGAAVSIAIPAEWDALTDLNTPEGIQAQSTASPYIGADDWRRVRFTLDAPDAFGYGEGDPSVELKRVMQVLAVTLPITTPDFPPTALSEVREFVWDGFPAAVFTTYSDPPARPASDAVPPVAAYEQVIGVQLAQQVMLLRLRTTLPPGSRLSTAQQSFFDAVLASLTINGDRLDPAPLQAALRQLDDPLRGAVPVVASLRIGADAEVRIAAPEQWTLQETANRSQLQARYFFEDDLQTLPEGNSLPGAIIQVSLLGTASWQAQLTEAATAEADNPLDAYVLSLVQSANPGVTGSATNLTWGAFPITMINATYPAAIAAHPGGTRQQTLMLPIQDAMLVITIYAPQSRWEALEPIWHNILGSLVINGALQPPFDEVSDR